MVLLGIWWWGLYLLLGELDEKVGAYLLTERHIRPLYLVF